MEGDTIDGWVPHGKGSLKWNDGSEYGGDWIKGQSHGNGKYVYTNGIVYVGEF